MLYQQNGDRILTIDFVTSLHPMYTAAWHQYHGGGDDEVVRVQVRFAGSLLLDDRQDTRLARVRPLTAPVSLVAAPERLERQRDQHPTHRLPETEIGGTVT